MTSVNIIERNKAMLCSIVYFLKLNMLSQVPIWVPLSFFANILLSILKLLFFNYLSDNFD